MSAPLCASLCGAASSPAMVVLLDLFCVACIGLRSRRALAAENLFLPKRLALFLDIGETSTGRRFHAVDYGDPEPDVRVPRRFVEGQSRHPHSVALQRVPAVLALEIQTASALRRAAAAHGEHEAHVGQHDANWPDWYAAYIVAEQSGREFSE
jgi:hypothetical protein